MGLPPQPAPVQVELIEVPPILTPIFNRVVGQSNAGTAALILCPRVPADEWQILDFASVYNQSGESLTCQWVIVRGQTTILVSADMTVADGAAVGTNILPQLMEQEQFGVQVKGTSKSSQVTLVVSAHSIP